MITSCVSVRSPLFWIPPPSCAKLGEPGHVVVLPMPPVRPFLIRTLLNSAGVSASIRKTRSVKLPSMTEPFVPDPAPLNVSL